MKKFLFALLLLPFISKAQVLPIGASKGTVRVLGKLSSDTLLILPNSDTTTAPKILGGVIMKTSDKKIYVYTGTKWAATSEGAVVSESDPTVPAFIKLIVPADTVRWAMAYVDSVKRVGLNVYTYKNGAATLAYTDSIANVSGKLDSIRRSRDSVYWYAGGSRFFAFIDSTGGEVNTGANVGSGAQVFQAKVGLELRFKTLISGNGNISITPGTNEITLTGKSFVDSLRKKAGTDSVFSYTNGVATFSYRDSAIAGGEINTISSVGSGVSVVKGKTGVDLQLKSLTSDTTIAVTGNTNDVQIKVDQTRIASVKRLQDTATALRSTIAAGDTIYVKNVGTGMITGHVLGDSLRLSNLVAGSNITLTKNADSSITITGSGGGASLYVKQNTALGVDSSLNPILLKATGNAAVGIQHKFFAAALASDVSIYPRTMTSSEYGTNASVGKWLERLIETQTGQEGAPTARKNVVWDFGYNTDQAIAGEGSIRLGIESNYRPGGGAEWFEYHDPEIFFRDGTNLRGHSITASKATRNATHTWMGSTYTFQDETNTKTYAAFASGTSSIRTNQFRIFNNTTNATAFQFDHSSVDRTLTMTPGAAGDNYISFSGGNAALYFGTGLTNQFNMAATTWHNNTKLKFQFSTPTTDQLFISDGASTVFKLSSNATSDGVDIQNTKGDVSFGARAASSVFFRLMSQGYATSYFGVLPNGNIGLYATPSPAISLVTAATDAWGIPKGTTAQRPTGVAAYTRWNTDSSRIEVYNGTIWRGLLYNGEGGTGGGGSFTLNTLTASTQTFATGTSGTDFNISSTTSTHTFNIPDAGSGSRGLVNTGAQDFQGVKTFTNKPLGGGTATGQSFEVGTFGISHSGAATLKFAPSNTDNASGWQVNTDYMQIGINAANTFGNDATRNGAEILFDTRSGVADPMRFFVNKIATSTLAMSIDDDGEIKIGSATDQGTFKLQNTGDFINVGKVVLRNTSGEATPNGGLVFDGTFTGGTEAAHAIVNQRVYSRVTGAAAFIDDGGSSTVSTDHTITLQSRPTHTGGTLTTFHGTGIYPTVSGTGVATNIWNHTARSAVNNGTTTENVAYHVENPTVSGSGVITNNYGLKVDNLTTGTNNYSVHTGTAQSYFGGTVRVPSGELILNDLSGTNNVPFTLGNTANNTYPSINYNAGLRVNSGKFLVSDIALKMDMNATGFVFRGSNTGTAGGTITFTDLLTVPIGNAATMGNMILHNGQFQVNSNTPAYFGAKTSSDYPEFTYNYDLRGNAYKITDEAYRFRLDNGFKFFVAASGTAGTAPTFTEISRLTDAGEFFLGSLTDNGAFTLQNTGGLYQSGAVRIIDGNQAAGKVLTSDASGNATWQAPSTGSGTLVVINDADYTVAAGVTNVVYSNTTAGRTVTLPTASSNTNRIITIKHGGGGAFNLTTSPAYRENISTTASTIAQNKWVTLMSNGTDWYLVSTNN